MACRPGQPVPDYYVTLIEHLPEPAVLVAPDASIKVMNARFSQVSALRPGDPLKSVFAGKSWEEIEPVFRAARAGVLSSFDRPLFHEGVCLFAKGASLTPLRFHGAEQAHVLIQFDGAVEDRPPRLPAITPGGHEAAWLGHFPDKAIFIGGTNCAETVWKMLQRETGGRVPFAEVEQCLIRSRAGDLAILHMAPVEPNTDMEEGPTLVWEVRLVPFGSPGEEPRPVMAIARGEVPCPVEIEENRRLAALDSLTELANRRAFLRFLKRALSSADRPRSSRDLAVLYIDLDEFKKVNDIGGHEAGDTMLLKVAACLRHIAGPGEIAARIGGDEFALALSVKSKAEVTRRASEILDGLDRIRVEVGSRVFTIGASVGAAYLDRRQEVENVDLAQILKLADAACLKGKRLGGRTAHVITVDSQQLPNQAREVTHRPIESSHFQTGDLALYCLPVVCLKRNDICGEEILLRIGGEQEQEEYSARSLVSAAERDGYIAQVDSWTLDQVMDAASERTGRRWLTVNVSVLSAADPVFRRVLAYRLRMNPLLASRLCLEISERDFLREPSTVESFFHFIKGFGCQTAIDDFSGNWPLLARVARIRPDWIKLDAGLVRGIESDEVKAQLLDVLANALDDLGSRVIAKHVESADAAALLKTMKIAAAQGYHYGRPQAWPCAPARQDR
ncbi:bifunctional diguanylate cyclase/phosphodiesterase [Roseibium aquae]|uniref:bifunctional diguanylate cyclase/phosphodiesterase n=1 Tax=Roseibium aquae TaxID=1323746 RepID=UPI00123CD48E|nr:bifunctional diguanylate cyclase/phosphodiesterase [Roseibium aquae]